MSAPSASKPAPATALALSSAGALSPVPGRLTAPGWTPERQRAFIEQLAATGSVTQAAAFVGLSRQSAYQLRDRQPNTMFALAWNTAMMLAKRALFDIAMERAVHGREEAVWCYGEQVGTRIVHSDRLLMRMLDHELEPIHPALSPLELHQMWPTMLQEIDAILPPVLDAAAMHTRLEEQSEYGNDDA